MTELRTPTPLIEALRAAARRTMTPEEIFEQRVSWVYGQLPHDDPRTREQVREEMRNA